MKPARVAAVHRLAGQAGGKKTKYTTAWEDVQQPRGEDGILITGQLGFPLVLLLTRVRFFIVKHRPGIISAQR